MFLPAEDHHSYAEGLRRGGFLLSANVEAELYDRALEIMETGGAVDMDERGELAVFRMERLRIGA